MVAVHISEKVERFADELRTVYEREAPRGREGPHYGGPGGSDRTSRLWQAWRSEISQVGQFGWMVHGEVDDSAAPHGKWIDQPVAVIRPVNGSMLRWFGYHTGEAIFAKEVHPSRDHEGWWQRFLDKAVPEALGRV